MNDKFISITSNVHRAAEKWLPLRCSSEHLNYLIHKMDNDYELVISLKPEHFPLPDLKTAKWNKPETVFENNGCSFAQYIPQKSESIESLYNSGALKSGKNTSIGHDMKILHLYRKITALWKELAKNGLKLNNDAQYFLYWEEQDDMLLLRPEAVSVCGPEEKAVLPRAISVRFSNILGALQSEHHAIPLFDTGYINRGRIIQALEAPYFISYRLISKETGNNFLLNCSENIWDAGSGRQIGYKGKLPLDENLKFRIIDKCSKKYVEYWFVKKEQL